MTVELAESVSRSVDLSAGVGFVDGRYVPISEAKLSVLDWGFTRSDCTYDVVHVWQGSFFRLDDHLDRFLNSCRSLRLDPGHSHEEMREILTECVRSSSLRDAYVEMVCTRGKPVPGSRDPRTCSNNFIAFAIPFVWVMSPQVQEQGGHLIIASVPRIPRQSVDPTVKNFHWGDLTKGLFEALDKGADTAVLIDIDGYVSEGPGFNVFCVQGRKVLSPGDTVLEGITRKSVRELCDEQGFDFELTQLSPQTLRDADEVFISSTAGGIMPIRRVDDRILSNDAPGEVTLRLRQRYWEKHLEGWHATAVNYG